MMSTTLKKEFHELIDKTDNPVLLEQFYKAFAFRINNSKQELWDSLTEAERIMQEAEMRTIWLLRLY
jgi:hypothetical protein